MLKGVNSVTQVDTKVTVSLVQTQEPQLIFDTIRNENTSICTQIQIHKYIDNFLNITKNTVCQLSATLGAPCRLIFDTIHNTLLSLVHFLSPSPLEEFKQKCPILIQVSWQMQK